MIDKKEVKEFIDNNLKENHYLIDFTVSATNHITIFIDSFEGVNIEECIAYSRLFEKHFDRDVEDYELVVSSGGIDLPFTVPQQFEKNLNKDVELITTDGKKEKGMLKDYNGTEIVLEVERKEIPEGKKRKEIVKKDLTLNIEEQIKTIKPTFSFKKK